MIAATVQHAVDVLNRAFEADPEAVQLLIENRVNCNKQLADDHTIQVGQVADKTWEVGMLGIINGIFGVDVSGWGYIAAMYNDGNLVGFKVLNRIEGLAIHVCRPDHD